MANPEIDNYVPPEVAEVEQEKLETLADEIRPLPKQESTQELTHYYKIIFTLKSGRQIEICSRKPYTEVKLKAADDCTVIGGFIKTPLLVEKAIKIDPAEIAAMEQIKDPCIAQVIPWPSAGELADKLTGQGGIDGRGINNKVDKPLVNHKSDCAVHNDPPCGFSFEVTSCDCGAIVPCTDAAGQDRTKHDDRCRCMRCLARNDVQREAQDQNSC